MIDTPLHLLLIEDDDDHFELIRRHLRRAAGDTVTILRVGRLDSGMSCLQNSEVFDAILTDLHLPDSSGVDTFRKLRDSANGTPLIALTSHSVTDDGVALMQEGAHDFLPKSKLDGDLLLRSVLCAVERKRLNAAEVQLHQQAGQMEMARRIQSSILPESVPQWPFLDVAAETNPAEAVGGDYYDFIALSDDDFLIAIGDATGHGPGAALIMAMAAASLRTLTAIFSDLGQILTRLNALLVRETPSFAFMTFCALRFNRPDNTVSWANAGHPCPALIRTNGADMSLLESKDGHLPLGLMPDVKYAESESIDLNIGDLVYMVTDGVTEAMNPDENLFGQKSLDTLMQQHREKSAAQLLSILHSAVQNWRGGRTPDDDETALVMRWQNSD